MQRYKNYLKKQFLRRELFIPRRGLFFPRRGFLIPRRGTGNNVTGKSFRKVR
jgi:hypothetical protein